MSNTPQRLGTLAQASEYYLVSDRTLRRWIAQQRLTGYRFGPRAVRVDLDEVAQLLQPIPTAGDAV